MNVVKGEHQLKFCLPARKKNLRVLNQLPFMKATPSFLPYCLWVEVDQQTLRTWNSCQSGFPFTANYRATWRTCRLQHEVRKSVVWQIFTGRIELFQQAPIGGVEDAIFCPCSVFVIVLAKELQLVQSAQTQCLRQQQKQPIYLPFLFGDHWLHTIILVAQRAVQQPGHHPMLRCSIMQRVFILHKISLQLNECCLQQNTRHQHPPSPTPNLYVLPFIILASRNIIRRESHLTGHNYSKVSYHIIY